jgi:hypothetical protein
MIRDNGMENTGIPRIAGSFSNWEVRPMIPLIEFCETMDVNKPDPI